MEVVKRGEFVQLLVAPYCAGRVESKYLVGAPIPQTILIVQCPRPEGKVHVKEGDVVVRRLGGRDD